MMLAYGNIRKFSVIGFIVLLLPLLCSCIDTRRGTQLPFSTIHQGFSLRSSRLNDLQPKIIVFTTKQDVETAAQTEEFALSRDVVSQPRDDLFNILRNVNYDEEVAILVLKGMNQQDGTDVRIDDVRVDDDKINIYISFLKNDRWYDGLLGGSTNPPVVNDPFKLITVAKSQWSASNKQFTFNLLIDETLAYYQEVVMH